MNTDSKNNRPTSTFRQTISGKPFIIGVVVLLIYTLAGFFLVPYLVKGQLEGYVKRDLGRQLTIKKVHVNPFALSLELKDVVLLEADGTHLFSFNRFLANFELKSLLRRAWTFGEIGLTRPELSIRLESDGGMNLGRLISDASKKDEAATKPANNDVEEKGLPRLSFDRIFISEGHLLFADQSDATPAEIQMDPIDFEISDLSTIPEKEGAHTIAVALPKGGMLKWEGTTSLAPFESKGTLALTNFKESIIWLFLQDELNLVQPAGTTDLNLSYFISNRDGTFQFVLDKVTALISGLQLMLKGEGKSRLLALDQIQLSDGQFDLASKKYKIGRLNITDGDVLLNVDQAGRFNWPRIVAEGKKAKEDAPEPVEKPNDGGFSLVMDRIDLDNVALKYQDESRQTPMDLDIGRVDLSFSFQTGKTPPEMEQKTMLEDISLALEKATLHQVGEDEALVDLPKLNIGGGLVDFVGKKALIREMTLDQGQVALWTDKDGVFNFSRFKGRQNDAPSNNQDNNQGENEENTEADSQDKKASKTEPSDGTNETAEQTPWSFELSSAKLDKFALSFTDRKIAPSPVYNLTNLSLGLNDFKTDPDKEFNFDFSFGVKQGGRFTGKGEVNPFKPTIAANIDLASLNLSPLEAYLQSVAKVALDSGDLSIKGDFKYGISRPGALGFTGQTGMDKLQVTLPKTKETLVSWKKFDTRGIKYSSFPPGLVIKEMKLSNPTGKLVIRKDKSVNFSDVIVNRGESTKKPAKTKPFPVDIKQVQIDGGKLDFADLSLLFPFHVDIHGLSGAMGGLSSKSKSRASVELKGRVQQYGTVTIKGNLQPFDIRQFFDVKMAFKNLEMTELTPYTAEFAGRKISSGKLFLDLNYRINDSQLEAENDLVLDYFVLGEPVENAKATNLPLDLAVALMKDADDRIDIGLPISGDLDDPKFGYGHLIWKAIVNLVTKVVAAPFKALGALIGSGEETLDTVIFDAGYAELPPPEMEKLARLAGALGKRPQLTLEVQGCYDAETDGSIMKENALKRELAQRMGIKTGPGQVPGPINFSDVGIQKTVLDLAGERLSSEKIDALKRSFGMLAESKKSAPKPGKQKIEEKQTSVDPNGFYAKLFEELVNSETLNDETLVALSVKRSQTIIEELTRTNGLPLERTRITDPAKSAEVDKGQIACKMNLGVSK